jgi:class 3 adenylate cyclase/tetratricopeptide (TPR) repeat protein
MNDVSCPACGIENDTAARACRECGAVLAPGARPQETRKVVTVLFSDVTHYTSLARELDPESLRHIMERYFAEMKAVLERHGGSVEKFIGDAVMAVFGVPQVHEDDALRAVRAAVEMRDALRDLNDDFGTAWGVGVSTRTGLNTGEVVAGDPSRGHSFVTGEAVNLAARLEQAAGRGEILMGEATVRLVRDAVHVEEIGPLTLKGMADPVQAWSLRELIPGAPGRTRSFESPLVGRRRELAALEACFERTAAGLTCEVVTVMGAAGAGKSRLTDEFVSRLDSRATVISGRCLPYGEGITFWPIIAVIGDAAGIGERDSAVDVRRKIGDLMEGGDESALITDRLCGLLGVTTDTPGIQESFWAVRRLLEHLAVQQPLVVVLDDIQWGESTFLDLLDYLGDWLRDAPVLIVCLTRPELLEDRPGWSAAKANATVLPLEPLSEQEADGLIRNLLGGEQIEREARARIADVAEGNPLFVEETLRMLVDQELLHRVDGIWTLVEDVSRISIPPTINALLSARLDRLTLEERGVIERAAVVGRVFWWDAVAALSPESVRGNVSARLNSLMRKELIRPNRSKGGGEDMFRFAHILVRDAAYNRIPKTVRAELHEHLADWIAGRTEGRAGEFEEILAYHLEQAHGALRELGSDATRLQELGRRAAAALAAAGRKAFARGDMPAAVNLLSRAASLLPADDAEQLELSLQLAFALLETGDFTRLRDVVGEMTQTVADSGLQAQALILGLWIRLWTDPEGWAVESQKEALSAIAVAREAGDERGLSKGWALLGLVHGMKAEFGSAERAWAQAAEHARLAGDRRDELESLSWIPLVVWGGPTNAEQGLDRCRAVLERVDGDRKAMSSAFMAQATFEAGLGNFAEARHLLAQAKQQLEEFALTVWMAGPLVQFEAWVELLAGNAQVAEQRLRWGYQTLHEIGEVSWLSTVAALLAESLYAQGRHEEAEEFTQISESSAGAEDAYSQALLRSVRAKVLACRGEFEEAVRLAEESVALTERTDFVHLRWHSLMSLAEVEDRAGHPREATVHANEAIRVAEQKGSLVAAQQARSALERLTTA